MTATRSRDLLAAALVVAILVNVLVRLTYGVLPAVPLFSGATLAVLGLAEVLAGQQLRARIRRLPGTVPVQPLVAARAVLVAKASALGGSIVAGAWVGLLLHVVPRGADVAAAASDTASGLVGVVCAVVLIGGGLWLEHCCRTPDDPRPDLDPRAA